MCRTELKKLTKYKYYIHSQLQAINESIKKRTRGKKKKKKAKL